MIAWAVVAAAGKGERAGLGMNKVFTRLNGRSVLRRCLDALQDSGCFAGAVLVLSPADADAWRALCEAEGQPPLVRAVVEGGATRRASIYNGLKALPPEAELVAIHDAARPFVSAEVIRATLDAAAECGSGVISTPVVDTIRQLDADGAGSYTLARERLRAVQTPQSFRTAEILRAHEQAAREGVEATDDAALYEKYIGPVRLVGAPGAEANVKLTNRADFERYQRTDAPRTRIGSGYDAHRLKEGRKLILCGVEVPHTRGLDGHSDADVALHALMDALLGALGEGDIGRHFPDSDDAYKGISSMLLLERVMEIVRARGYVVGNADVTIVAQKPKLAAYMAEMRANMARGLGTDIERVNVKATTTERMGFEGEETGISAQAVALLERADYE